MTCTTSDAYRHIVFDMDGVLIDSERIVYKAWMQIGEELGLPGMHELFFRCMGTSHASTARIFSELFGSSFDYLSFRSRLRACYLESVKDRIPLKEGALEILAALKEHGWKIALASSSRQASVMFNLERSGLLPFFDSLQCGDMIANGKPAPDIYLTACKSLGALPSSTYAVEDSKNGLLSASAAGLRTFLVPDMLPIDEDMKKLAWKICSDLHQVRHILIG